MGSLFKENRNSLRHAKVQSKGQRLGWTHVSNYEPVRLRDLSAHSEKLCTYASGPFSTNKLVP